MTTPHRIVARFLMAMEHPSEDAKKKYLKDHPNADPSNHTVKKQGPSGGGGGNPKKTLDTAKKVFDLDKPGQDMAERGQAHFRNPFSARLTSTPSSQPGPGVPARAMTSPAEGTI